MPTRLPYALTDGDISITHKGFGVCKLRGRMKWPAEVVAGPYEFAEKAVAKADTYGADHAAFRLVNSKSRTEPRERIDRKDLPVAVISGSESQSHSAGRRKR